MLEGESVFLKRITPHKSTKLQKKAVYLRIYEHHKLDLIEKEKAGAKLGEKERSSGWEEMGEG